MPRSFVRLAVAMFCITAAASTPALAHCDGMDGPVVKAARQALETGNVSHVLLWVQKSDEPEIRNVFAQVLAVRKLGPAGRDFADRQFFETLVRIHRAGEGAPYTGLKPAGHDLGPGIPAADNAIEEGSARLLLQLLSGQVEAGLQQRFKAVVAKKGYSTQDTAAGREYVKAYVDFMHYVERVYGATTTPGPEHSPRTGSATPSEHQH